MHNLLPLLAFFLCLTPVNTSAASLYSADGDRYIVEYNDHGAVMTSEHEKYFPEKDTGAAMKQKKLILYLGVQCDAFSEHYGSGIWGQSTGGFVIRFDRKAFGFIRQEIAIPHGGKCMLAEE